MSKMLNDGTKLAQTQLYGSKRRENEKENCVADFSAHHGDQNMEVWICLSLSFLSEKANASQSKGTSVPNVTQRFVPLGPTCPISWGSIYSKIPQKSGLSTQIQSFSSNSTF